MKQAAITRKDPNVSTTTCNSEIHIYFILAQKHTKVIYLFVMNEPLPCYWKCEERKKKQTMKTQKREEKILKTMATIIEMQNGYIRR